tara:strand:- start:883 stop:1482 length:600 start_codon:yes stop_codon:yes gene_type:complete
MANPSITLEGKKYPMTQVTKTLLKIGKMWRKNARISLKMQDKVNTGTLYNSIPVQVGSDSNGFFVNLTPKAHYWEYVDKGVQGASRNAFTRQSQSPFKFGSGKGGPGLRGAINKWVRSKGFQFQSREEGSKGQFMSYDSTAFMVGQAVWHRGLKPTFFISDTKKRIKHKALKLLSKAIGKDYANALKLNLQLDKTIETK